MLWNSLMCIDYFSFKSLSLKVFGSKPNTWTFDFIQILAQIINKILTKRKII
jgi:hypothetical protein